MLMTLAAKNLLHRPVRSLLTVAGIAVGIAAVVAMVGVADGFQKGWERIYTARGTDLVISRVTSSSPMPELFSESMGAELLALPHVERAAGVLDDIAGIEDAPMVLVFGWAPGSYLWEHLRLVQGRWPDSGAGNTVVIGNVLADVMRKTVGDTLSVEAGEFRVCGIFESSAFIENSAVVMPLERFQRLSEHPGKVRHINLRLAPGTPPDAVESLRRHIRQKYPGFRAYSAGEVARNNTGLRLAKAMSWATTAIALLVGVIGVMNTVLMSVFERIREIGILLALGWRRSRVVRMILYEAVALSLVGGLAGAALGAGVISVLERVPAVRGKLEGEMTGSLLFAAMAVALGVGILGGLYPAVMGSRLQPGDALRRE